MKPEASLPIKGKSPGPEIEAVSQIGDMLSDLGRQNTRNSGNDSGSKST